jgi:hypothetical protein
VSTAQACRMASRWSLTWFFRRLFIPVGSFQCIGLTLTALPHALPSGMPTKLVTERSSLVGLVRSSGKHELGLVELPHSYPSALSLSNQINL